MIIKLLLLGDSSVGKTSVRQRFLGKGFQTTYHSTLGADFALHEILSYNHGGKDWNIRYQIWDLAGQPHFQVIRKTFYLGGHGALILYDVSNPESLKAIIDWIKEFYQNNGRGMRPIILVGNKTDLRMHRESSTIITTEAGEQLANRIQKQLKVRFPIIEVSAKTGENIDKAFQIITDYCLENVDELTINSKR